MTGSLLALFKKDFRLMVSGKFFLLALGSLILYSGYINFIYVRLDQEIFPVYQYGSGEETGQTPRDAAAAASLQELEDRCADGYSIGLHILQGPVCVAPEIVMVSSGMEKLDNIRKAYAISKIYPKSPKRAVVIGENDKEMKSRKEISAEFLFFELTAVGFLGLAAMLFKEKQMGVLRVHGILPVRKNAFILSKILLILLSDLLFSALLTMVNVGVRESVKILPAVLLQTGILSLIMGLTGFLCAVKLSDFKQFSLAYLVLAVFITSPVFLVGQTGAELSWIIYHPMYHLFMAIKNAYFQMPAANGCYYVICGMTILFLFLMARQGLKQEMKKEG